MVLIKTDGKTYLKEKQNFLIIFVSLEYNNKVNHIINKDFHVFNKEYFNFVDFVTGKHQFAKINFCKLF